LASEADLKAIDTAIIFNSKNIKELSELAKTGDFIKCVQENPTSKEVSSISLF
jgi:hypothetical protein